MQSLSAASAAFPAQGPRNARASGVSARPAQAGAGASSVGRSGPGLVTLTKSVDHVAASQARLARFAAKWQAASLLKEADDKTAARLSKCGYTAALPEVELKRDRLAGSAFFGGLRRCGSVWLCPCCSPRIAAQRKGELDRLLIGARAEKLAVVMLTLTFGHDRAMRLGPSLDAMKGALRRFRQRREWRALSVVGSVTATEVTFGRNGWHPHFHILILLNGSAGAALDRISALRPVWLASLQGFGLTGNEAAYQVQSASAAGAYVAKFGAAEEMALTGNKQGRKGSRSPWQLLSDARDGDSRAGRVWLEYAAAFKGRRQLVWSPGLKARFGVEEVSDDEAAAEGSDDAPTVETVRAWLGASMRWRDARRRRCALVDAAEGGGDLDRAEFGPTDAFRWRKLGGEAVVEPPD